MGTLSNASTSLAFPQVTIASPLSNVAGSSSGSVMYSQPFQGSTYKKVMAYCSGLNGTASYTFPTPFINTPIVSTTNSLLVSLVTALTTASITITGAASTGYIILEGY